MELSKKKIKELLLQLYTPYTQKFYIKEGTTIIYDDN